MRYRVSESARKWADLTQQSESFRRNADGKVLVRQQTPEDRARLQELRANKAKKFSPVDSVRNPEGIDAPHRWQ
jgi:hypothetical protein